MESWSYATEEKGFVSEGTIPPPNTLARSKNALLGWELENPCASENDMLVLAQHNIQNQGFGELSFSEMGEKPLSSALISGGVLSSKLGGSPILAPHNAFFVGDGSNSKLSNSVVDSNSQDSLIDLKLGQLGDPRDAYNSKTSRPILTWSGTSAAPKRVRGSGIHSQTAFCQVYGCNKDLTSSKDYHKRHKVCEVHTKTAKVVVNGLEQRFCQQCSRFHLLAEFDDVKRSCRKRLAGHNERRRKPQVGVQFGRTGRWLRSYDNTNEASLLLGGRFEGTMLTTESFICQEMQSSGVLHSEKFVTDSWYKPIKVEDGKYLSAVPITNKHLYSRSLPPTYNIKKPFPTFHENVAPTRTGSVFCENDSRYTPVIGTSSSGSCSMVLDGSSGNEDFSVFDTASAVQGLSGISDSGGALSLLSSQSPTSSSYSSDIPMARPLVMSSSHGHCSMNRDSVISHVSMRRGSYKFPSDINSTEQSPVMMPDISDNINFEPKDGILQGSEFVTGKGQVSCEDDTTIDLLQLSSQLQRVEHQRQSIENDSPCCLRIT